jgi:hypothetical protein
MLKFYELPKLKVLVDKKIDSKIYESITQSHCEVFTTDLSKEELIAEKILKLTNNADGFDLTSNKGIALDIGNYDWMSFEILNEFPDYVFIPFGSGFFIKLIEIAKNIIRNQGYDKRYKGNIFNLPQCNFIGATTTNLNSLADKLYSPFLPFAQISTDWVLFLFFGAGTRVRTPDIHFTKVALYQLSYAGNTVFKNLLPAADFKYNSLFRAVAKSSYSSL